MRMRKYAFLVLGLLLLVAPVRAADLGHYYFELDAQILSTTTEFDTGTFTAVRSVDGSISVALDGEDVSPIVLGIDARGELTLRMRAGGRADRLIRGRAVEPSMAWAAEQARLLYLDTLATSSTTLVRDGNFLRLAKSGRMRTAPESRALEHMGLRRITTRFRDFEAQSAQQVDGWANASVPAFTSVLRDANGEEVMRLRWYDITERLQWQMRGGKANTVTAETIGGWKFRPDATWANIQMFALRNTPVHARTVSAQGAKPGEIRAMDSAGCDGLHWLDGSIFRPCCDRHDLCYEANGCTYRSWFFLEGWSCQMCNVEVVVCFATFGGGGGGGNDDPYDHDGGGGDDCVWNGGCPAWCSSCTGGPGGAGSPP
jgi:hypothetical protein